MENLFFAAWVRNRGALFRIEYFRVETYDIQTRPFLKPLIRLFNMLPSHMRTLAKFIWMAACYPYLIIFYLLFSNEYFIFSKANCYLAYQIRKI